MSALRENLLPSETARAERLLAEFAARYERRPAALVAAPGRVNLLGEHTDYNGLPVLPAAIDRSVLMAAAPRADDLVRLDNLDASFSARSYRLAASIPPFPPGDWGNYHKAAVQGLIAEVGAAWRGGEFLVQGDIPPGAGLSSSSALVVASALAFLAVNERDVPFTELAELLPRAERYVGTLSGGMDQATSLLAESGHALRIDFFPLRVRSVPLPGDAAIVVSHSLVRSEKSAGARAAYNLRVLECRLACCALERALATESISLRTLGDLVTQCPGRKLASFVPLLQAILPDRALALPEIALAAGVSVEALRERCAIPRDLHENFAVVRRARHVLREADRVDAAERYLERNDPAEFGRLMFASHASCRDDYEVSCDALDDLVETARRAGALGARLTGAGFGGCTVNLVRREAVQSFLEDLDRGFYAPRLAAGESAPFRFVLSARGGARVLRL